MTTVAADYGYRDGSGIHCVIQRVEEKAKRDRALSRRLKALVLCPDLDLGFHCFKV